MKMATYWKIKFLDNIIKTKKTCGSLVLSTSTAQIKSIKEEKELFWMRK